jgi:hypothetical protein
LQGSSFQVCHVCDVYGLQNFCLEFALPCSPFRLLRGKESWNPGEGASRRATPHEQPLRVLRRKKAGKRGSEPHGEQPLWSTSFFGNLKIAFPIPSNISLTFGDLAGENKKAAENIRFQTARFANRLRSSTNRFENCPARATIIRFKDDKELVNRLVFGLFSFFPGQFNLSEIIWFASD